MKDYKNPIKATMNKAKDNLLDIADAIYQQGYEAGKQATLAESEKITYKDIDDAYNRGLADMLEAVKSMRMMTADDLKKVFGVLSIGDIFVNLSPSKIISKYHAFKAQIKELEDAEIKVGDEVYSDDFDDNGIVSHITEDGNCVAIISSGSSMMKVNIHNLYKTGRHFPQIAEVLEKMRGAE